jgi:hypothetical protein
MGFYILYNTLAVHCLHKILTGRKSLFLFVSNIIVPMIIIIGTISG